MSYLVIGLGNPGKKYERTRHNAGRMAVEEYRARGEFPEWRTDAKRDALVSDGAAEGRAVILALPETFMNESGKAMRVLSRAGFRNDGLVVCHDDIDLPFGTIRISFDRGSGGHKGVESVIDALGGEAFSRVRIGIAPISETGEVRKPSGEEAVEHFVLGAFNEGEREGLPAILSRAADAIGVIITAGVQAAMNRFN